MRSRELRKRGFTLVEIVLVIVLIGILAAIVVPKFTGQSDKAKIAATKANIESIRSAIRLYQSNNDGALPATLAALVTTYIKIVPEESVTPSSTVVAANTGAGGWVYVAATGEVSVNLAGNDSSGDAYSGY